jgi:hypothetical protein
VFIAAKPCIALRYSPIASRTMRERRPAPMPISRPATTMLAARRFKSHSHGPGRVSSKSFRSKMRSRSGEPNMPKFATWASPQSCTRMPVRGLVARSEAITAAAPRKKANGDSDIRP